MAAIVGVGLRLSGIFQLKGCLSDCRLWWLEVCCCCCCRCGGVRPRAVVTSRAKHHYHEGSLQPCSPRAAILRTVPSQMTDNHIGDSDWSRRRRIFVEFWPSKRRNGATWSWDEGDRGGLLADLSGRCPLRRIYLQLATICCRPDCRLRRRLLRYDAVYADDYVVNCRGVATEHYCKTATRVRPVSCNFSFQTVDICYYF